jgi:hypothetical protein
MKHSQATLGDVHQVINWLVADTTARLALTVTVADLYKICYQLSTAQAWMLTSITPTWTLLNGALPSGGTTGQNLRKLSNTDYDFTWATDPFVGFSAYNSVNQNISTSLTFPGGKLSFDTEEYDYGNYYNTATSRYTPGVAGLYSFTARLGTLAAMTGNSLMLFAKNGSSALGKDGQQSNSSNWSLVGEAKFYMNGTTDYIEVYALSNAVVSIGNAPGVTFFQGTLLKAG